MDKVLDLIEKARRDGLKITAGKSLAEVAKMRSRDPIETIMDLMLEDHSRVDAIYFLMSEENISKELRKPWVSLGSDETSQAPEGVFSNQIRIRGPMGTLPDC